MKKPKPRKLYYSYSSGGVMCCVVSKLNGNGIVKSYGEHHRTPLDSELKLIDGIDITHCDNHIIIEDSYYPYIPTLDKEKGLKALYIICKYYNVSERIQMEWGDFFDFLTKK